MTTAETIKSQEPAFDYQQFLLLPDAVVAVAESLRAVLTDMNVLSSMSLAEDYNDLEGIVEILIYGPGVPEALDNYTLKHLESCAAFMASYKLEGRRVRVILSTATVPSWED